MVVKEVFLSSVEREKIIKIVRELLQYIGEMAQREADSAPSLQRNKYFSSLDALRGFAALAVAIYHIYIHWCGYLAVDFFLVLSGFVLSHVYLYSDRETNFAEFIGHRLARLYPLHIYALIVFTAVYFMVYKHLPEAKDGLLFTFIQHLTLTHNIGFNPKAITWNYPSWSISVEFWVNVLFVTFITKMTRSSVLFLVSLMGFVMIYNNSQTLDVAFTNYYGVLNSGMIRGISSFLLGILAYRMYLWLCEKNDRIYRNPLLINASEVITLSLSLLLMVRSSLRNGLDFCAPFAFTLTVVVFAMERGLISKTLKKFRYLGTISYSIYLNQVAVMLLAWVLFKKPSVPSLPLLVVYLSILLVYSHLTYKYLEKPARIKGRQLVDLLNI